VIFSAFETLLTSFPDESTGLMAPRYVLELLDGRWTAQQIQIMNLRYQLILGQYDEIESELIHAVE
jgi:hypothetical protein